MVFLDEALLKRRDVINDIVAALNMCRAIKLGVVHQRCPFSDTANMAEQGLVRLMARFEKGNP